MISSTSNSLSNITSKRSHPGAETFNEASASVRPERSPSLPKRSGRRFSNEFHSGQSGRSNVIVALRIEEVKRTKEVLINQNDFRRMLEAKRNELLSDATSRDEILIENAAEEFDRLQQQLNREVAIRNLDRTSKLLKSVQAALSRIDDKTYAVCLRCDEQIPDKRLKAVPWTGYCVACQEEIDRQHATGEVEDDSYITQLAA